MADMNKRPVAFRIPRLFGDMVSHYCVTTSEDEARAMADTNQVEYEGLYLVGDRHTGDDAQAVGVREALIEQCARICDEHAKWAEAKITEPPESSLNQSFAATSLAANDCAEKIRDLLAAQPPAAPVETERRCQKCGESTKSEEALVDGQIWCHPCADHPRSSADNEPAAWLSTGDNHHGLWREKPDLGDGFQVQPLYLRDEPQESPVITDVLREVAEPLARALMRCQTVLHNMAAENEGPGVFFFNRWPINHEPLRADAKNLVPVVSQALSAYHAAFMKIERETSSPLSRPESK